jgi:hypothetical protein
MARRAVDDEVSSRLDTSDALMVGGITDIDDVQRQGSEFMKHAVEGGGRGGRGWRGFAGW